MRDVISMSASDWMFVLGVVALIGVPGALVFGAIFDLGPKVAERDTRELPPADDPVWDRQW
jgi:hypothetical protein